MTSKSQVTPGADHADGSTPDISAKHHADARHLLMLAGVLALGDAMIWQVMWPGLSLVVFALCLVAAACLLAPALTPQQAAIAGAVTGLSVLPVADVVQPLSLLLLPLGVIASLCIISGSGAGDILRAIRRYPWIATRVTCVDAVRAAHGLQRVARPAVNLRALILGWTVPLGLGGLFVLLITGANPVVDQALYNLIRIDPPQMNGWRVAFWMGLLPLIWGALTVSSLHAKLTTRRPARLTVRRPGLINAASVTRSLVIFNALFAVQTALDLTYLTGGAPLPEGMSYATYAHRGAYPLLVTALLAGVFAILARPFTDDSPLLRALLLIWLVQTIALVMASLVRLEIYIDVYGLTRLRLAALIWIGLVATGLALVIWQVWQRKTNAWMLLRAGLLGLVTLYASALFNFDGTIARYNLTHDVPRDAHYLCRLSEAVIPHIKRHTGQSAYDFCSETYRDEPEVFHPQDWREWGFRNWRLRRSLAAMQNGDNAQ